MPSKTVPLSVRISDEDAAFLAKLEIGDAKTPSEKLRALLASERRLRTEGHDPSEAAEMIGDLLRPALRRIKRIERETAAESEPLRRIYDRLPDLMALALSGPQTSGETAMTAAALKTLEARASEQALALCEDLIGLSLTAARRKRSAELNSDRLQAILELVDLVRIAQNHSKGEENG